MRDMNDAALFGMSTLLLANLHITTIGHGYASYEHVDHTSRLHVVASRDIY